MRFFRMIAATLAAVLLLAGCGAPAAAPSGSTGSSAAGGAKTFTVGMECNYAPFNWTQVEGGGSTVSLGGAGYADGYDVVVAQAIADKLGAQLVIKKIEWSGLEPALSSGEVDAVIAGMTKTPERDKNVDFTEPYYESEMVCIVRGDDPLAAATALADFTGKNVMGQLSTLYDDVIDQIPSVVHKTPMQSYPLMVLALQNKEADAITAELPVAQGVVAANPGLAIVRFAKDKGFVADTTVSIAVKEGNTQLRDSIQSVLDGLDQDTRAKWMLEATQRQPANG